jgi:hypothetical protein
MREPIAFRECEALGSAESLLAPCSTLFHLQQ